MVEIQEAGPLHSPGLSQGEEAAEASSQLSPLMPPPCTPWDSGVCWEGPLGWQLLLCWGRNKLSFLPFSLTG